MAKRFSLREFGLLMAPIMVIGAVGFWATIQSYRKDSHLTFQLEEPTTLQRFQGTETVFVVEGKRGSRAEAGQDMFSSPSPYFELQTPGGLVVSRFGDERWSGVWGDPVSDFTGTRFPVKLSAIPAGELTFGCKAKLEHSYIYATRSKFFQVEGRWKIDRTKIHPSSIASWPRQPLLTIKEVAIDQFPRPADLASGFGGSAYGKIVFNLQGNAMNEKTIVETSYSSHRSHPVPLVDSQTGESTALLRVKNWESNINARILRLKPKVFITGRASADGHWPLGFEIEPFDFKTARVGQKLKFKQFPVALPKG